MKRQNTIEDTNVAAMLTLAARLTERANHCQTLLIRGLGIPVILIEGRETNKARARELITRARKVRLARELVNETFTNGQTIKAEALNEKLVALR